MNNSNKAGAFYTGIYPCLFEEIGITQEEMDKKIKETFEKRPDKPCHPKPDQRTEPYRTKRSERTHRAESQYDGISRIAKST